MAFQRWQIGLDIQNRHLCALGIERRRHGWQLRHWWQQALPHDTLRNGVLQTTDTLIALLTRWQQQLPQRYSLRVGLPPQLVLQRTLPLPNQALREPALSRYITAAAQRLFPVEPASLSLDYRQAADPAALCVTAARSEAIAQWLAPLRHAGLRPDVFELSSLALAQLAMRIPLRAHDVLTHPHGEAWLWVCGGASPTSGISSDPLTIEQLRDTFPQAETLYCTQPPAACIRDMARCHPFSFLHYLQPPLPPEAGEFAVALGLALRPEDA
jgi:pilus assembly protein HofM